jgi:hypothetical protein
MSTDRTTYPIKNEQGEWMRFTLSKWIADVLQANLPNLPEWLQGVYKKVAERFPLLTRREKFKTVRRIAFNETARYLDLK